MKFLPKPVNNHIPIWIGGMWPNKKLFQRAVNYDGACPISGKFPQNLTPDDIVQMLDYMKQFKSSFKDFDIYIEGYTPEDLDEASKILRQYEKAGVTWWGEMIDDTRFSKSFEKMHERILKGPPKI